MKKKLKIFSRVIVLVCGLTMIGSLFVPVWQIQLEAPQYPEGLKMEIWANKLGGDVDKINGLNHYIGMSLIHEENFPEFKVMPWLIIAMIALSVLVAITGRRIMLWFNVAYLALCGVWGSYDFWKWEYEYGHNLDPHAAIKVPGMTYQPPLFGWKQLLNFLAGSFPDVGGWLIIAPAVIIVGVLLYEIIVGRKRVSVAKQEIKAIKNPRHLLQTASAAIVLLLISLSACSTNPDPIEYGKNACEHCKMIIMDKRFGAEVINPKGKVYKFDSGECMVAFLKNHPDDKFSKYLVVSYENPGQLIDAGSAFYLQGENIKSPMGGNLASFKTREAAEETQKDLGGNLLLWDKVATLNF